jgi:tetratricopeptide (TPR) repeat protein
MFAAILLSLAVCGFAAAADSGLKLARAYFTEGKFSECLQFLDQLPENERDAEALNMLGASLAKLGRSVDAERSFRETIQRFPHHLAAYHNLGQFYLERQSYAQAIIVLQDGLKMFPQSARLLRALGMACQLSGRFEDAHSAFERWVQLDPENDEAYAVLGDSYLESGAYDSALANLTKAAQLNPRSARVQYLLGLAHSYLGHGSESQACLRRAIELDQAFCLAYYQLAKGELDQNNELPAFELLKKTVACDPTQAPPHYQLSRIYSRRGESTLAEQEMRLFLKYRLPAPASGMASATSAGRGRQ